MKHQLLLRCICSCALPLSLQGQGPLAISRDIAGLQLHCRWWLWKRRRTQSCGVHLEKDLD